MIFIFPLLYLAWKFIKKTEIRKPGDVDLFADVEEIEAYTRNFVEQRQEGNKFEWWMGRIFG